MPDPSATGKLKAASTKIHEAKSMQLANAVNRVIKEKSSSPHLEDSHRRQPSQSSTVHASVVDGHEGDAAGEGTADPALPSVSPGPPGEKTETVEEATAASLKLGAPPKFTRFIQSMAALTEKTRMGREELEKMVVVTKDLKAQCQAQEAEFESLEAQQKKAKDEVNVLMRRIELLMAEKIKVEQRLEDLRLENNRLDAFLQSEASSGSTEE